MGERAKFHVCLNTGGKYALNSLQKAGFLDFRQYTEDFRLSGANSLMIQPIFYNNVHRGIQKEIDSYWWPKRWLYNFGIEIKRKMLKDGYIYHYFYDKFLFKKFRSYIGITNEQGINFLVSGSAPLSVNTKEFVQCVFARPMMEGYSMTEACGQGFTTQMHDRTSMYHSGGIAYTMEFKLVSVPELGAFVDSKDEKGVTKPKGEVCLRGSGIFQGYYKGEEATKKAIDQDGWYHTGDIGELLPEMHNGLRVVDRMSSCFKLSNGRFIVPEKLELEYKGCKLIKHIWLFSDPKWDKLLAVVNIHEEEFMQEMKSSGIWQKKDLSLEKLVTDEKAVGKVLWHMQRTIEKVPKIVPYQIVQGIIIEPISFNDLDVLALGIKLKRRIMKDKYFDKLKNLYEKIKA